MESISSPKEKRDTSRMLNPLTPSEIESLRQESKRDLKRMQKRLRLRKAQREAEQV